MPSRTGLLAATALVSGSEAFLAPRAPTVSQQRVSQAAEFAEVYDAALGVAEPLETLGSAESSGGWGGAAVTLLGAAVFGVAASQPKRTARMSKTAAVEQGLSSQQEVLCSIGRGGSFAGASGDMMSVISRCAKTGRAQQQEVRATTAMAAVSKKVTAINGFGRIGRNVFRVALKREKQTGVAPFDIQAINIGSMAPETAAHLLKYDTVLGTLENDIQIEGTTLLVDGKPIHLVSGRDPTKLPWASMGVDVVIESTGAFNSLDGGSKHLEAGAKKVVITAPGKNCPTYVIGVNEKDYDPVNENVISNASCTTNGMASVCKVLDEHFGVEYGMMTTTHSYTGDQKILDAAHTDLRRARAAAQNIVPTSTGAAQAVAQVLPHFEGKLSGIAFRVPVPNVSVVDLVLKVSKKTSKEEVNAALQAAAEGPLQGIINFETKPLVSSDFMGTPYSNSVDAALTMVMGEDLVKVVLWYDNEWGYSERVVDLTAIVADSMPSA